MPALAELERAGRCRNACGGRVPVSGGRRSGRRGAKRPRRTERGMAMTAEIIAVGTELLLGDILNTNAQFLSQQLAQLGITVHFQSVVGRQPRPAGKRGALAMQRSDLLVFSGGLGPTDDDLTKQTVARL